MSSKNVANTIITNSVNSTKKWLYRYLLDNVDELDKNYSMIEKCIKDIYIFQNAILEQIEKEEEKVIIGNKTLNSIFKDEKNLNRYDLSLIYDSVLYFRESATILRDEEKYSIEKILKIIRSCQLGIIHIGDPEQANFLLGIDEDKMPDEETYKNFEKRIRCEIAEECKEDISREIYHNYTKKEAHISRSDDAFVAAEKMLDIIMGIIRGD